MRVVKSRMREICTSGSVGAPGATGRELPDRPPCCPAWREAAGADALHLRRSSRCNYGLKSSLAPAVAVAVAAGAGDGFADAAGGGTGAGPDGAGFLLSLSLS